MQIKHRDIITPKVTPPGKDWKQCWYGLYRLKDCYSVEAWGDFKDSEEEAHESGYLGERELEVDIFLSILEEIQKEYVTFIELGAGYADWCLALNGVIRNKLTKTNIKETTCYAVEAEPTHIDWCIKHFKQWKIKGEVIPCIISDKNGRNKFAIDKDPASNYGQSIFKTDSTLSTIGNILRRKTITIYSLKLDSLLKLQDIDTVDIIDMDVQGNEVRVVKGAMQAIQEGRIDYWKIGTHGAKYNRQLNKLLNPYYDLVVDVYPNSVGGVNGLKAKVQDGIQVYKRKGL